MMEKMARFRCSASTSLNWGEGWFYFSFYSVQDCRLVGTVVYYIWHLGHEFSCFQKQKVRGLYMAISIGKIPT